MHRRPLSRLVGQFSPWRTRSPRQLPNLLTQGTSILTSTPDSLGRLRAYHLRASRECNDPAEYQDAELPNPRSQNWSWLKSLSTSQIGKTFSLPDVSGSQVIYPAGNSKWEKVLVTPQIVELADEFRNAARLGERGVKGSTNSGMILDGPYGMGKTTISRLLVSMAFVNQPHLDYHEIKGGPSGACYFLKRFLGFNATNAARIPVSISSPLKATNLFELAAAGVHDESQAQYTYERLIAELKEHSESPVVFAIDDFCDTSQNSSFKEYQTERPRYLQSDFRFIRTIEELQGDRTFILLSNTGYFAPEERLSGTMQKWVRHLKPLPDELFVKAIADNGPFPLPKKWAQDERTVKKLQFMTGSLPSGLCGIKRRLDRKQTLEEWSVGYYLESISPSLARFKREMTKEEREKAYPKLIEKIFYPEVEKERDSLELLELWQKFKKTDLVVHDETTGYRPRDGETETLLLSEYLAYDEKSTRCDSLREFSRRLQSFLWYKQALQDGYPFPTYLLSGLKVDTILPGFRTRKVISFNKPIERNNTTQPCLYAVQETGARSPWDLVFHCPPTANKEPDPDFPRRSTIHVPDHIDQSKHQLMFVAFVMSHHAYHPDSLWLRIVQSFEPTPGSAWLHSENGIAPAQDCLSLVPAMMSEVELIARRITGSECKARMTTDGMMSVEGDDIGDVQFVVVTNLPLNNNDEHLSTIKQLIIGARAVPENANLRIVSNPGLAKY